MWEFLSKLVEAINSFLQSKVVLLIIVLLALYFGILKIDTLREFAESVKELF